MMLVPPGATVDAAAAASFDTSSIKRTGQAYGTPRTATTPARKSVKPRKKKPQKATSDQFLPK